MTPRTPTEERNAQIAGTVAGLVITALVVIAFIEAYGQGTS